MYDQEFPKADFLKYPRLYSKGMRENYLSWNKYFKAMAEAVLHGMVVFAVAYGYFDYATAEKGYTSDMRSDGNLCYASVIIAVTLKILLDSSSINILVVLAALLSIGAYFLFVYLMGLFVWLDIYD